MLQNISDLTCILPRIRKWWTNAHTKPGGIPELWRVAYPLILTTASGMVIQFINRIFLAHYSTDSLAACVPAGILSFTMTCFFVGVATYTNVFVAQYYGAKKPAQMVASLWQGVWVALLASVAIIFLTPIGLYFINASSHPAAIKPLERDYFSILMLGGGIPVINTALSAFYTGRGKTKVTLCVNLAGYAVSILLSYLLIFGKGPFPEMGITGAGWAFIISNALMTAILISLILGRDNNRRFKTRRLMQFHPALFKNILRFGLPNGVGFLLDVASFTVFVFLVGNSGKASLAANNIIMSINSLAFMPILGVGIATTTLVGQYMGRKRPDVAEHVVFNALKMASVYALTLAAIFFITPGPLVNLFVSGAAGDFAAIKAKAFPMMKILAFYILFDATGIIFGDAIKGAGDTKFQMTASLTCAWLLFVPGTYFLISRLQASVETLWLWALMYIFVLALVFYSRFRSGKWREIDIMSAGK